jgi:hypothetical protein
MELRRKNEYLETLFNSLSEKSSSSSSKILDNTQMQTGGGGDIKVIFNNLLTSVNDFTKKWTRKSSVNYQCDETEIQQGNIDIKLNTDLTTYFP